MRVLVACEFSGTVRDAFIRAGHEALSCDILPTESAFGPHYQGDVRDLRGEAFDLVIAHPPCTFLSYAGIGHWHAPGRAELRQEALEFAVELYNWPVERLALENPKGWLGQAFRAANQYVNPFDFGEPVRKRTGLWLRNLPNLTPVNPVPPPAPLSVDHRGKNRYMVDSVAGSKNQAKKRSKFFVSIAEAMADQWGKLESGVIFPTIEPFAPYGNREKS